MNRSGHAELNGINISENTCVHIFAKYPSWTIVLNCIFTSRVWENSLNILSNTEFCFLIWAI